MNGRIDEGVAQLGPQALDTDLQYSGRDFVYAGKFLNIQRNKSFKNICSSDI